MRYGNYGLRAKFSILSTIRTSRMGLWCVSRFILAHHLCSPIRASRMGSWRYCPGLLKKALYDVRHQTGAEPPRWLGLNKNGLVFFSKCGNGKILSPPDLAVTERVPFTISLIRRGETLILFASRY